MHISSNLSHWVCVLAGLYLVVTGLLLRDVLGERPPVTGLAASGHAAAHHHDHAWYVAYGLVRRGVMIAVGLTAIGYGISRIW